MVDGHCLCCLFGVVLVRPCQLKMELSYDLVNNVECSWSGDQEDKNQIPMLVSAGWSHQPLLILQADGAI